MSMIILTALCGVLYTAAVTGITPHQANGSVIAVTLKDGTVREYGSVLIEQEFTKPQYLIGRPMGATNLAPGSDAQKELVRKRIDFLYSIDPDNRKDIPMDLVTASGPIYCWQPQNIKSRVLQKRGISAKIPSDR